MLSWTGLYEIYCEKTESSYFGHSENVIYLLGRHYNDLETTQSHDRETLQKDWVDFGREAFLFRILELGPE